MEKMDANQNFSMFPEGRPQTPPSNPLAIVALVIAIVALPLSLVPVIGLVIALVALVLGIVAKGKARQGVGNGAAIGAIVAAVVALLMSLVTSACTLLVVQGVETMDRELKNQGIDLKEIVDELKSEETRVRMKAELRDLENKARAAHLAGDTAAVTDPASASGTDQVAATESMEEQRIGNNDSKRSPTQTEIDARPQGEIAKPADAPAP